MKLTVYNYSINETSNKWISNTHFPCLRCRISLHIWQSWYSSQFLVNAPLIQASTKQYDTSHIAFRERHLLQLPIVTQVYRAPFLRMRCGCMCGSLRLLERSTVQFGSAILMVLKAVKVFCYSGCASSPIIWCGWFRIQFYWAAVKYDLCRDWYCNSCPLRHFFF